MPTPVSIFWFRRDLRLDDNAGLYHALRSGYPVVPIFIFDTNILDDLEDKNDRRVDFIHQALQHVQQQLIQLGSAIHIYTGSPADCFRTIMNDYNVQAVYTNHDYEPYAKLRDDEIDGFLKSHNIELRTYKDQVLFEKDEIVKADGKPYTVYTPYSKKHKSKLNDFYLKPYPTEKYYDNFYKQEVSDFPCLEKLGFLKTGYVFNPPNPNIDIIKHYNETRDFPYLNGTSKLSVHLRFGTISIRKLATIANELNEVFLNELLWRDFYHMLLWQFPKTVNTSFYEEYDNIKWRNDQKEFKAWCEGQTGYPIVDAGMRELAQTGYMHNRVRMVVASFLTKHLLIDWRWGETWFSKKLMDYDMANNIGGWQWAAGCGCDAAPYFRIFNPYTQTEKFDPQHLYIKKWVPEYCESSYTHPIVIHAEARERCLKVYKDALSKR